MGATTGPITVSAYSFSTTSRVNFVVTSASASTGSELLYVASNGGFVSSGGVVVVDAESYEPIAAIETGGLTGGMISNPAGSRVYVINSLDDTVSVLDTATHTVLATIDTDPAPARLFLDTSSSFLYAVCTDRVTVIDLATNTTTASIDPGIGVGYGNIYAAMRDAAANRLYAVYYRSGGANNFHLARIDMATGALIDSRAMVGVTSFGRFAADRSGARFYFEEYSQLQQFDVFTGSVSNTFFVDFGSFSVSPIVGVAGDPLYALRYASPGKLYAIDSVTGTHRWNFQLPGYPERFMLAPGESEAYVATSYDTVSVVNLHDPDVSATIALGGDSISALATSVGGERLYALDAMGALQGVDTQSQAVLGSALLSGPGQILVVNTVTADRLGVARRQHQAAFGDVHVDVPFEVVVQAHHAEGSTNVAAPTVVSIALASGTAGNLSASAGCTIPAGGSYCLARGLVIDTRQSAARLVLTATSGDTLAPVTSPPFAVIGTVDPIITSLDPDRGPVGATVRIIGTDLKQDPAIVPDVSFNGVPAVVTSSTDEEIVVTVPTGATTGPVTVQVSGSTAESPGDFTVLPVPSIVFSGIEPPGVGFVTAPYFPTVSLTKPSPAGPELTGTVTITDLTNQVSCTFTLPETGCSLIAPYSSPYTVLLSARYSGDFNYGYATSTTSQYYVAQTKWTGQPFVDTSGPYFNGNPRGGHGQQAIYG